MTSPRATQSGLFITVEGVEGVGKTTNLAFIKECLQRRGIEFLATREPGGTPLAEQLRELLLCERAEAVEPMTELLMIFAARAQHLNQLILPALAQGRWVLSDRFTDATYAYQGAGRGLPSDAIEQLEALVQRERHPDVTFFLDSDVETGLARAQKRGTADRFEREARSFFERVRAGYWQRIKRDPERFIVIDASGSLTAVQKQIAEALHTLVERYG